MPEPTNQAAVLARKTGADAIAVRELAGNAEITDEIIGFHAQQAIEKWLKALMAHRGMDEVRIHDIGRLLPGRMKLVGGQATLLVDDRGLTWDFSSA